MDRTINDKSAAAGSPSLRVSPATEQGRAGLSEDINLETQADQQSSIRRFLTNPYLTLISRFFLGTIFLLSGLTKLGVPQAFTASINGYEMPLPSFLVQVMAVGLPPLELALGVLLLVGLWTRFAAAIAGGLMVVFTIAMTQAAFRGLSPDCGCFSGPQSNPVGAAVMSALGPVGTFLASETVGVESIARDIAFLLMAVHLFFVPSIFSIDNWRARHYAEAEVEAMEEEEAGLEENEIDEKEQG